MKKKKEIQERIQLIKKHMEDKRVTKSLRNKYEFAVDYLEWVIEGIKK